MCVFFYIICIKHITQMKQCVHPSYGRVTRSVAANSPTLAPPSLFTSTPDKRIGTKAVKNSDFYFL